MKALIVLLVLPLLTAAQAGFVENKGQWHESVYAKFEHSSGAIWLDREGWSLSILNESDLERQHDAHHDGVETDPVVQGHAVKVKIEHASDLIDVHKSGKQKAYHNYFLGSDRSKWKSNVGIYDTLLRKDVVHGIDLLSEMHEAQPKLTFIVNPGSAPQALLLNYSGARSLEVNGQSLRINTPEGAVTETGLKAFQLVNGQEVEISCRYRVLGTLVGFELGDYDSSLPLYIDPIVVGSTNSGSTVSCYGHTATYDILGNIYGGGRCFGVGYPTDTGSFQMNYAGGGVDMGISKFNADASSLIYATYIGGSNQEFPHSMYVNELGYLYILGTTASSDFPVSENAFDTSYNGGTDISLTVLAPDGDSLIGSTFFGGTASDGSNGIVVNYGDGFRGEIIVDGFNEIYISCVTSSTDFPVTAGVVQDTLGGSQDGIVAKFNYNLSQLKWSTYLGGTGQDAAYGLKLNDEREVYVCGSTQGQGFPVDSTGGGAFENYSGGANDGFVLLLNSSATSIIYSSYFGTADLDQNFFIQLDQNGEVYLFGQSNGAIASSAGIYQGPSLGSYIYRTPPELDTIIWTSGFGNLAPTAFLVDLCSYIYIAGHGALSSINLANFDTLDAVSSGAPGGFYLMAVSPDGTTLEFGSVYGNNGSHVDGGTSRFDKRGIVYEATCSNGVFPTTAGAYSTNAAGGSYDLTVFKVDFEVDATVAYASVAPFNYGCAPFDVQFSNLGSEGNLHFWDFGDGTNSIDSMPTHTFDSVGIYKVKYAISDTNSCNLSDTAILFISVVDSIQPQISFITDTCSDSIVVSVDSAYANMQWSTGAFSQSIEVDSSQQVWIEVQNQCGVFSDSLDITIYEPFQFQLMNDTAICELGFLIAGPDSAVSYLWQDGTSDSVIAVTQTGTYSLTASDGFCATADSVEIDLAYVDFGASDTVVCNDSLVIGVQSMGDQITWSTGDTTEQITVKSNGSYWVVLQNGACSTTDTVNVGFDSVFVDLGVDTTICEPFELSAFEPNSLTYNWSTGDTSSSITVQSTSLIIVTVSSAHCSITDSIRVQRFFSDNDTNIAVTLCNVDSAILFAEAAPTASFGWNTGSTDQAITVKNPGNYIVEITSGICRHLDTFQVRFVQTPDLDLGPDIEICIGETATLSADTSFGRIFWSTQDTSQSIIVSDTGFYWASMSFDGCFSRDTLYVAGRKLVLPSFSDIGNVFTPNQDGLNDRFEFMIEDQDLVKSYSLVIYNRWGGLVYTASHQHMSWDGSLPSGEEAPNGVYFYLLEVETHCDQLNKVEIRDNVTLFR